MPQHDERGDRLCGMISEDADRLWQFAKENLSLAPMIVLVYGVVTVIYAAISTDNRIIYLYDYKDFMLNAVYVVAFSVSVTLALYPLNYFISRKMYDLKFELGFVVAFVTVSISLLVFLVAALVSPEVQIVSARVETVWLLIGAGLIPLTVFGHRHFFLKSQLCLLYFMIWSSAADLERTEPVYVYQDELCIEDCSAVFISRVLTNYLIYYQEGDNRMAFVPLSDVSSFKISKGATRQIN